jgi:hypothetical protein
MASDVSDEIVERPCRYCMAAYGSDAEMCGFAHLQPADVVAPLALKMARSFQGHNPSMEQIGWFMEDAAAVIEDFDPLPEKWSLRKLPLDDEDGEFLARFRINGVTYIIENGEGHCTPVRLATYRGWQREAELSHSGRSVQQPEEVSPHA